MVTLENVVYSIGDRIILNGINFTLTKNEKAGLVGINGVGKSTLLEIIIGRKKQDSGNVLFSRSISSIGYMSQVLEIDDVYKEQSVLDFLLSGRPIKGIKKEMADIEEKLFHCKSDIEAKNLLDRMSFLYNQFETLGGYSAEDDLMRIVDGISLEGLDLSSKVFNLSGGQKSKVNFIRVLYSRPGILFLDEPTNHLDVRSKEWLISYLLDFRGPALIISHDQMFLDRVVSKIIRIDENKKIAEIFSGNFSHYLSVWNDKVGSHNRLVSNQQKEISRLQDFVVRMNGVSGKRKRQAKSKEKAINRLKKMALEVPRSNIGNFRISPKVKCPENPLHLVDVHFGYSLEQKIIKGVSLILASNEKFVIIGKNGSGKSTLLKLIAGKIKPCDGMINLSRNTFTGYYAQEQEGLNMGATVLEDVASVSGLNQQKLRSALGQFMFTGKTVFQKVETLSPGERSRLALAKISLLGSNLLILDEPTNHLDKETSGAVATSLRSYDSSIVVVSHDVGFLEALGVERMLILPDCVVKDYDREIVEKFYLEA